MNGNLILCVLTFSLTMISPCALCHVSSTCYLQTQAKVNLKKRLEAFTLLFGNFIKATTVILRFFATPNTFLVCCCSFKSIH